MKIVSVDHLPLNFDAIASEKRTRSAISNLRAVYQCLCDSYLVFTLPILKAKIFSLIRFSGEEFILIHISEY